MKKAEQKFPWYLLLTFLVLSLNIWAAGYYYYHTEKENIQKDKQEDLLAIADLKVKQITDWRRERLGDGEIISKDPFFAFHVREWFQGKDPGLKQKILSRMQSFQEYYQYKSLVLLDSKSDIRLAVPDGKEVLGPDARQLTVQAMRTKKIIFSNLYKSKIQNIIRLTIVVPLIVSGEPGGEPIGVLLLRVDPFQFLYPLLQSWPTPSKSAETVMVRREGNDVVFLNELRHRKDTALTLRFPVTEQNLPAGMAVRGTEGIVDGTDYREVSVIAGIKHIPDSPWFLIAKVDQEEIYAPIRQRLWITIMLVSIMILAAGGFIGLIWRHQGAIFYQERYEAELKRLALLQHFEYLTKYANDIILLSDGNLRIIEGNDRAALSYGYTGDELIRLHLRDLRSPETRPLLEQQMEQAEEQNGLVYETIHQRKDGTKFPAEVSARVIAIEGGKFYQHIVRDITERKQAEKALRESEQRFKNIIEHSNELFYIHDTHNKLTYVSPQSTLILGYTPGEMMTEWTNLVTDNPINKTGIQMTEQAIQTGERQQPYLLELYKKDRSRVLLEIDESPLINEQGAVVGIVGAARDVTENKKAEESLIREKQFSDTAINSMPGVFYLFDRNGRFVRWNRNFEIFTGYSAGEISKMNPLDFFSEEEKKLVAERIQEVFIKGYSKVEAHLLAKDGSKTPYLFTGLHLVMDEQDFLIGTGTDISDLRRVEKSLIISEEKYRTLLENLPQKIFSKDIHSVFVSCNQSLARDLGITPEELTGKTDYDFFPKELADKYRADDQRILKSGRAEAIEEQYIREGQVYIIYTVKTPLKDEQGNTTGILGIFWDITEQKHAEEELKRYREHLEELVQERTAELEVANRQLQNEINDRIAIADALRSSEEKYRSIVDNIGIGISLISPKMEILSLNSQMRQWFPHIDVGKKPICYQAFNTPPTDEVCSYCPTGKTLQDGKVHISVTETPVAGQIRNYRLISSPIRDKDGSIVAAIEMVEDITERRRAEEEIIRLNQELQHNIAQLENTNKELESFSYSVSHDLRSPLRSIDGFSRVLLDDYSGKLDEEGRKYLHRVRNASQRMGQLIDDLLNLSRVSRREMRHELVDLSALVNTIAADLRSVQPDRQIAWSIQPGIFASGDAGLLRILFENLLGNAVKFTEKTEDASIEFGRADHGGEEAYSVRDNGAGFDMTYSDKLFGAFQRLHSQDEFPGTGIGLAIVQRIVNRHGGRIWAEGTVDKGAAFFFTLPAREAKNRS